MICAWRIPTLTEQMYRATVRAAASTRATPNADTAGSTAHLIVRLERLGYTVTHPHRAA
jgi:hypothetical protein